MATAEPLDYEMQARATAHRAERADAFVTYEEPLEITTLLADIAGRYQCIVLDCLTLWMSNLILAGRDIEHAASSLAQTAATFDTTLILVTNEVGCGIVPENELARSFRDFAGAANQQFASAAREVYWMVFGIAVRVK